MPINRSGQLIFVTIFLTLFQATFCFAEHDLSTEPSELTLVDKAHRQVSATLTAPAEWFDNFFSDPRFDEESAGTFLRLRGSVIAEEGEKLSFKGKAKARLRLPNLKRRFHLILSSEEEDLQDETLQDARINSDLTEQEGTTVALQYRKQRSDRFSLTHQVGVTFENGFNPNFRSRIRYSLPIAGKSILTLAQSLFWENEDGFGEESRIDLDVPLDSKNLIRTTGNGLFSESSNGYQWLAMVQWLRSFSHKKALALGSSLTGETRPQNHLTEYDAFLKYRQRFIKKWLFVELKPEIKWTRDQDFKAISLLTLTFEVQFND